MSKVRSGFIVFALVIFFAFASHWLNRSALKSDPDVMLALSAAQTETQPLIDALEQYHLEHGVYPRSVKDLPKNALWGKYLYQTWDLNSVYKSLDCQRRIHDLMGFQTPEKLQRFRDTRNECLLGYSQFILKTQVHPSRPRQMFVFVVFQSANPKWDIDWCSPGRHGPNHCYEELKELRAENRQ
jgi:hypothetical protein